MSKKISSSCWVTGLAVAIAVSGAQAAWAQAGTPKTKPDTVAKSSRTKPATSAERIKISKEAPGEVAPPDTVTPPPPPPPVVEAAPPPPPPPPPPPAPLRVVRPLGLFAGLGGGLAFGGVGDQSNEVKLGIDCIPGTNGDPAFDRNHVGYNIAVPFGIQRPGAALGFRGDVGYSSFQSSGSWLATDGTTGFYRTRPQIWTVDADARLKVAQLTPRLAPYVIGGLSWGHYRTLIDPTGSTPIDSQDQSWHNAWGWNAGAGLEYMLGRTGLFVESRYFHLNGASGFNSVSHVPLIVGLTWY
ncbi:MAG TPA: hypothetical protein VN706_08165 [Gemmatimonadaceae bacterium]|nr:hypothetical protein [Gemmatimonadaceae bacterium]